MTSREDTLLEAARCLVALIRSGSPPDDQALTEALDRILVAYHDAGDCTAEISDADWPEQDYNASYAEIGARFPELGYYMVANPLDISSFSAVVGDAIDDLVDIAHDLEAALWNAKQHGFGAALGHLRCFFFHWAGHARELLFYLHAKRFQ